MNGILTVTRNRLIRGTGEEPFEVSQLRSSEEGCQTFVGRPGVAQSVKPYYNPGGRHGLLAMQCNSIQFTFNLNASWIYHTESQTTPDLAMASVCLSVSLSRSPNLD